MAKARSKTKAKSSVKKSVKKTAAAAHDHEGHIDSCDLDFTIDTTSDADLPPARGGVEAVKKSARAR